MSSIYYFNATTVITALALLMQGCFDNSEIHGLNNQSPGEGCEKSEVNCGLTGTLYYLNSDGYVAHDVGSGGISVFKNAGPTWTFGLGASKGGDRFIGVFDRVDSTSSYDVVEVFNKVETVY